MPQELRTDLNGLRVRLPGSPPIYLIDLGKRRHIPNPQVYDRLFTTWAGVIDDIDIDEIWLGDPIPETAMLFACSDSPKVFLLDGIPPKQVKRHVFDPATMERYKFRWPQPWNSPLNSIGWPDGPPIKNP